MTNTILQGDVIERLKDIKDNTIQCVVTSPPYWGLRDYGTATWIGGDEDCSHKRESKKSEKTITGHKNFEEMNGVGDAIYKTNCLRCGATRKDEQLGLEETPEEYVENMVKVFREVRRTLKDDGTLWLNIGDTYSAQRWTKKGMDRTEAQPMNKMRDDWRAIAPTKKSGLPDKNLVGIPWRVALALQADGWYLRQDIIWHKPNPMPESVTDRCTKSHEYIFLLTKSANYYYDADAIREPIVHYGNNKTNNLGKTDIYKTKKDVEQKPYAVIEPQFRKEVIEYRDLPNQEEIRQYLSTARKKRNITIKQIEEHFGNQAGHHWFEKNGSYPSVEDWKVLKDMLKLDGTYDKVMTKVYYKSGLKQDNPLGANKRSVWKINTKPYKEAHFAVFPEELPTLCIKAGSKKGDIVLDPFFGSGTTGYVAQRLYRKWLGIELNKDYIKIAEKRFVQQELF